MPEASKAKIKLFFYNYGKTDVREKDILMKLSKLSGFKESNNRQLLPIRQLDLFSKRNKIESDSVISESAKKEQIAAIDKQLAALN